MSDLTVGRIEQLTTKPDQAQGLRELVKGGVFEQIGLPAVFDKRPIELDYKALWLTMKEELEFDATHHDLEMIESGPTRGKMVQTDKSKFAQKVLSRMEQVETLAFARTIP